MGVYAKKFYWRGLTWGPTEGNSLP